tara:strand:+ start:388 stop:762 length:375 start_codon:yes stop_codon:yes gene_type:complete
MNIKTLKNIMKEVNQPKEFTLTPVNLTHELYWIWKVTNCRLKTLDSRLASLRKPDSRFDIFVWGGFISHNDFKFEQVGNDFHIKFIRTNFPSTILNPNDPNYGQPWGFEDSDSVKIEGDLENVI